MGRVSTSSPARDVERRRAGGTVLDAVLERITYANEETGYTIARVATDRSGSDLLTVVGSLLGVQPGESLRLVGRWGSHPKYGRQLRCIRSPPCCRPRCRASNAIWARG